MRFLFLCFMSITLLGYSSKDLTKLTNSEASPVKKLEAINNMQKKLKQETIKLNKLKKDYLISLKKEALAITKDSEKTNYEKYSIWLDMYRVSHKTKHNRSAKKLVYKFSKKALKDLKKALKEEENQEAKNNKEIVMVLTKILNLKLNKKQTAFFSQKHKIYDELYQKELAKKKEEQKKKEAQKLLQNHELYNKMFKNFRATVYNKHIVKKNMIDLSDYLGREAKQKTKLLVLSFYANYCRPCKKELPILNALYQSYQNKGLMVMAVNTDRDKDEIAEMKAFIEEADLQFPVLKDSYKILYRRYAVENFPTTFFINGEGKIIDIKVGFDSEESLKEEVIKHLEH